MPRQPRDVLECMLPLLRDKRLDALADLYRHDAVHELPYAPPGAPHRIAGREAIREYFTSTLMRLPLRFHALDAVAVHDTADPDVIVAEYDARGTTASGVDFTARFVWVLTIVDGEIAHWRDYMNPAQLAGLI